LEPETALIAVVNLTKPGVGGMRIETPVRVTEEGPEMLSKLPIDLMAK
jgi:Xaa-Pro aminopeptidase